MKKGKNKFFVGVVFFSLLGLVLSPLNVLAATTIGANITTNGNLTADGSIKFTSGAGAGLVLTSDASGNASWAAETDPVYGASSWATTTNNAGNWDTAFSWGDHSLAGYLTIETDPVYGASPAGGILGTDITNWNTAFGWGNHATAGYLTSYTETDPIFGASPAGGITGTNVTNWNTAYGWGNHATAGYLTSYTETDPIFVASPANGITGTNITNWNTAYGWGNHATAGYLTSYTETDPQVNTLTAGQWCTTDGSVINCTSAAPSGAPVGATYITQTADGTLTNEQALSALATGLVKNTNGTGVLSIATAGTDYAAASHAHSAADITSGTLLVGRGGTGVSTFGGANTILYTTAADTLSSITTGNNGVLVTSAGGVPSISSTLPSAVQGNITSVGTIGSGTWNGNAVGAAYGGTGITSYTTGDLLYASGATTLSKLADVALGSCLTSGGVGAAPTWGSCGSGSLPAGTTNDATLRYNLGDTSWKENTAFLASAAGTLTIAAGQSYTGAGAVTLSSGAATALTITSNAAATWKTATGALTIDSATALNLGTSTATSISIGKAGVLATVNDGLTVTGTATLNGKINAATGGNNPTGTGTINDAAGTGIRTAIIANTSVTANSLIFITPSAVTTNWSTPYISAISAGVSFTVAANDGLNANNNLTFQYLIIN